MNAQVYSAQTSDPMPWREAEALAPIVGEKAARLFSLPRQWCPAFGAISHHGVNLLVSDDPNRSEFLVDHVIPLATSLLKETGEIIVRSSIVGETIWDRGTYESVVIRSGEEADFPKQLADAILAVHASARGQICAVVLQTHMPQSEMGEFGNLLRISKTRDHWELAVRSSEGVTQTVRFNSQRDIAPNTTTPLTARVGLQRERLFGSVGAWINNELMRGVRTRVNCEWVRSNGRFYIVQIDAEDDDLYGVNPMQLFIEPSIPAHPRDGAILKAADAASRGDWDKLAVLDQLFDASSPIIPTLYYVTLNSLISQDAQTLLAADFLKLLQKNIVVRTSVRAGAEKILNLPKTDCMTADEAARWCCETAEQLSKLHPNSDLAFIAHRYIGSRASAWVRAAPNEPVVEIHGTWGLPDALQFCSYDIWEVHIPTEEVTEYPNYKSDVLLLQNNGSWRYERVKNDIARFQSISRTEIVEIARRSGELANRLGRACHIMWFVGCTTDDGVLVSIPWYWTEAHKTENPDRGNYQIFDVRNEEDLARVAAIKQTHRRLAISLWPDSVELLRDNSFLARVSDTVTPLNVPVFLSGSTLAHAFYQLRKNGCVVIPEVDKDHHRTRRQTNFGKLVRDRIPDKIASQGEQQSVATIPQQTRIGFLVGKFIEEILEAREAETDIDRLVELADIFEVLRALISMSGNTLDDVMNEADKKRNRVGGFDDGKLLVATSLPKIGEELITRTSLIPTDIIGELSSDHIYRVPFTFFGFSELGQQRVLQFPELGYDIRIVLQRDCVELTLDRRAEQLTLF
jgi:predicted house-cleaning noncanonical NTP pyrophosphatase (MazG superfamily)